MAGTLPTCPSGLTSRWPAIVEAADRLNAKQTQFRRVRRCYLRRGHDNVYSIQKSPSVLAVCKLGDLDKCGLATVAEGCPQGTVWWFEWSVIALTELSTLFHPQPRKRTGGFQFLEAARGLQEVLTASLAGDAQKSSLTFLQSAVSQSREFSSTDCWPLDDGSRSLDYTALAMIGLPKHFDN
ncbi:hypothetical protein Bbelb_123400 [Branchiostoma belcheri]|nr:hypothetical protein Bbelb_123400 [Branchiostoma belcheri]